MDTALLRTIGIYFLGAATGTLVGLLIVDHLKAREILEQEEYDWEGVENKIKEGDEPELTIISEESPVKLAKRNGKLAHQRKDDVINYADISKQKKPRVSDLAKDILGDEALADDVKDHKALTKDPYVITIEQFAEGNEAQDHDKAVFTWYIKDSVMINEDKDQILNCDLLLGVNWRLKFGQMSDDPDTVYIRNNKELVDYEVCRVNKSYREEVLGIYPEKPSSRSHRRKETKTDAPNSEEE